MNRGRFNLIVLVIGCALAVAAGHIHRARRDSERLVVEISARREQLVRQLRQKEAEFVRASERLAQLPAAAEAPAPPTPPPQAPTSGPRAANSLLEWLEDPKVQVLYFAKQRADLVVAYGPFFRAENLTAVQIERLSDLITQWRAHQHDMSEINRQKNVSFNDPTMVAARASGEAEFEAGVTELLGESAYAKLKEYARAREIREYVGRLAGAAAIDGNPLTLQQADTLAVALAQTCPDYLRGGPATKGKIDWQSAEQRAQAILSPAQFKLFRQGNASLGSPRTENELFRVAGRAMREMGLETR